MAKSSNKSVQKTEKSPLEKSGRPVLGFVLLALMVGGGIWYYYGSNAPKRAVEVTSGKVMPPIPQTALVKASQKAAGGDYAGAVVDLKSQLGAAATPTAKASANSDLYHLAISNAHPSDALAYAQKADALASSAKTKGEIGIAAAALGNWQLAYDSFTAAAALSPDLGADARSDRVNYNTLALAAKAKL